MSFTKAELDKIAVSVRLLEAGISASPSAYSELVVTLTRTIRNMLSHINGKVEYNGPINMVLYCPSCGAQHIDEPNGQWTNPPHRSHQCQDCGYIWRPADVPTNGVRATLTKGEADAPIMLPHRAGVIDQYTVQEIYIKFRKKGLKAACEVIEEFKTDIVMGERSEKQ